MTWRCGSRPKCWKTIDTGRRRISRSRTRTHARDVLAVQRHRAGRRLDQAGEQAHQRRLARPGEAHHDEDLTGRDVEGDVLHSHDVAGLGLEISTGELGVRRADDLVGPGPEDLPEPVDLQRGVGGRGCGIDRGGHAGASS